jgi:hypothetical protein
MTPSDRRDLTKYFPLRFEPIVECRLRPIAPLTVELMGSLGDQDVQILARRQRQGMRLLRRRPWELLLRCRCDPVRFCRTNVG